LWVDLTALEDLSGQEFFLSVEPKNGNWSLTFLFNVFNLLLTQQSKKEKKSVG
jgi:hypothetical protein